MANYIHSIELKRTPEEVYMDNSAPHFIDSGKRTITIELMLDAKIPTEDNKKAALKKIIELLEDIS